MIPVPTIPATLPARGPCTPRLVTICAEFHVLAHVCSCGEVRFMSCGVRDGRKEIWIDADMATWGRSWA